MTSIGQPDELILQIIVWLFPQTVLTNEWQLGETLEHTQVQSEPLSFDIKIVKPSLVVRRLTGQMFSLGVPSSWTIRSTCWISEVPGNRGLWASNSAKMQPTALQSKPQIEIKGLLSTHAEHTLPDLCCMCINPKFQRLEPHHMSSAVVWDFVPRRSSGALYLQTNEWEHKLKRSLPSRDNETNRDRISERD